MAASRRPWSLGRASAKYSKNNLGRTHSMRHKAGQKHRPNDVFDFPDTSAVSSIDRLGENDNEPYETFDPPLHSTAIYADEELSTHCGSSVPSTPQGKEGKRNSDSSENEASGNESMKISAKKPRSKLQPVSSESESSEDDIRKKVQSVEKVSTQQEAGTAVAPLTHSEKPAEPATLKRTRPFGAQSSTEKETQATQRQQKTQSKGKISPGKRKKSRSEATASYPSESMHIWCLEGKRISDIMELDVVLSVFENTLLDYRQRIESRSCKEAINNFFFNVKGELIKMLKEVQMLKTLKRKNTKIISDMEKKRQRLIEVQDELLRLEPQLKQLQTKYEELEDRKSSLKNSVHFLSDLKQLYQDYSGVQEKEPNVKEIYDSTSLPALLFKARTILGAENHLQNINHQLGKLLGQK